MNGDGGFHDLEEALDDDTLEELGIGTGIRSGEFGETGAGVGEEVLEMFFALVEEF